MVSSAGCQGTQGTQWSMCARGSRILGPRCTSPVWKSATMGAGVRVPGYASCGISGTCCNSLARRARCSKKQYPWGFAGVPKAWYVWLPPVSAPYRVIDTFMRARRVVP